MKANGIMMIFMGKVHFGTAKNLWLKVNSKTDLQMDSASILIIKAIDMKACSKIASTTVRAKKPGKIPPRLKVNTKMEEEMEKA